MSLSFSLNQNDLLVDPDSSSILKPSDIIGRTADPLNKEDWNNDFIIDEENVDDNNTNDNNQQIDENTTRFSSIPHNIAKRNYPRSIPTRFNSTVDRNEIIRSITNDSKQNSPKQSYSNDTYSVTSSGKKQYNIISDTCSVPSFIRQLSNQNITSTTNHSNIQLQSPVRSNNNNNEIMRHSPKPHGKSSMLKLNTQMLRPHSPLHSTKSHTDYSPVHTTFHTHRTPATHNIPLSARSMTSDDSSDEDWDAEIEEEERLRQLQQRRITRVVKQLQSNKLSVQNQNQLITPHKQLTQRHSYHSSQHDSVGSDDDWNADDTADATVQQSTMKQQLHNMLVIDDINDHEDEDGLFSNDAQYDITNEYCISSWLLNGNTSNQSQPKIQIQMYPQPSQLYSMKLDSCNHSMNELQFQQYLQQCIKKHQNPSWTTQSMPHDIHWLNHILNNNNQSSLYDRLSYLLYHIQQMISVHNKSTKYDTQINEALQYTFQYIQQHSSDCTDIHYIIIYELLHCNSLNWSLPHAKQYFTNSNIVKQLYATQSQHIELLNACTIAHYDNTKVNKVIRIFCNIYRINHESNTILACHSLLCLHLYLSNISPLTYTPLQSTSQWNQLEYDWLQHALHGDQPIQSSPNTSTNTNTLNKSLIVYQLECVTWKLCSSNTHRIELMNQMYDTLPNHNIVKSRCAYVIGYELCIIQPDNENHVSNEHNIRKAEKLLFESLYILDTLPVIATQYTGTSITVYSALLTQFSIAVHTLYADLLNALNKYKYAIILYNNVLSLYEQLNGTPYYSLVQRLIDICTANNDTDHTLVNYYILLHKSMNEYNLTIYLYIVQHIYKLELNNVHYRKCESLLKQSISWCTTIANQPNTNQLQITHTRTELNFVQYSVTLLLGQLYNIMYQYRHTVELTEPVMNEIATINQQLYVQYGLLLGNTYIFTQQYRLCYNIIQLMQPQCTDTNSQHELYQITIQYHHAIHDYNSIIALSQHSITKHNYNVSHTAYIQYRYGVALYNQSIQSIHAQNTLTNIPPIHQIMELFNSSLQLYTRIDDMSHAYECYHMILTVYLHIHQLIHLHHISVNTVDRWITGHGFTNLSDHYDYLDHIGMTALNHAVDALHIIHILQQLSYMSYIRLLQQHVTASQSYFVECYTLVHALLVYHNSIRIYNNTSVNQQIYHILQYMCIILLQYHTEFKTQYLSVFELYTIYSQQLLYQCTGERLSMPGLQDVVSDVLPSVKRVQHVSRLTTKKSYNIHESIKHVVNDKLDYYMFNHQHIAQLYSTSELDATQCHTMNQSRLCKWVALLQSSDNMASDSSIMLQHPSHRFDIMYPYITYTILINNVLYIYQPYYDIVSTEILHPQQYNVLLYTPYIVELKSNLMQNVMERYKQTLADTRLQSIAHTVTTLKETIQDDTNKHNNIHNQNTNDLCTTCQCNWLQTHSYQPHCTNCGHIHHHTDTAADTQYNTLNTSMLTHSSIDMVSLHTLLHQFDIQNVLLIYTLLCQQKSIIFVSNNLYNITASVTTLIQLLYPLQPQYIYLSYITQSTANILQCNNIPYIAVVQHQVYGHVLSNTNSVYIDCDRNLIQLNHVRYTPLPNDIYHKLYTALTLYQAKRITNNTTDVTDVKQLSYKFVDALVTVLHTYTLYTTLVNQSLSLHTKQWVNDSPVHYQPWLHTLHKQSYFIPWLQIRSITSNKHYIFDLLVLQHLMQNAQKLYELHSTNINIFLYCSINHKPYKRKYIVIDKHMLYIHKYKYNATQTIFRSTATAIIDEQHKVQLIDAAKYQVDITWNQCDIQYNECANNDELYTIELRSNNILCILRFTTLTEQQYYIQLLHSKTMNQSLYNTYCQYI